MVCEKCGAQVDDQILSVYCKNCGHKLIKSSTTDQETESEKLIQVSKSDIWKKWYPAVVIGGGALLAAVLVLVIIIQAPKLFQKLSWNAAGYGDLEYKENIEELVITDHSRVELDGDYDELTRIDSNGDVILSGEFPKLEFLTCSKMLECEETDFTTEKFPSLEEVHLQVKNADVDEDFKRTLIGFRAMYERGELSAFTYEVSHTVEDLYGEWEDENGYLSLTIMKDGNIRVGAGSGLLGAEILSFSEVDNSTLYLRVNGIKGVELFSLRMDYELMGDEMTVTLLDNAYLLKRK